MPIIKFPFRTSLNSLEEFFYELLHVGKTTLKTKLYFGKYLD